VRVQVRESRQDLPGVGRGDALGQGAEARDEARDRASRDVLEEDVELGAEVLVLARVFAALAAGFLLRELLGGSRGLFASQSGAGGRFAAAAAAAPVVAFALVAALFPAVAAALVPLPRRRPAGTPLREGSPLLRAQVPDDVRVVEPCQQLDLGPQRLDVGGEPAVVLPAAGGEAGGRAGGREVCKVVVVVVVKIAVGPVVVFSSSHF
jgi:hypothetical protein